MTSGGQTDEPTDAVVDAASLFMTLFSTPTAPMVAGDEHDGGGVLRFDFQTQLEAAKMLASSSPQFYLGAHVVILRGLLTLYCANLVPTDTITRHTSCLLPLIQTEDAAGSDDASRRWRAEQALADTTPRTTEDALLGWMRAAARVFTADSASTQLEHDGPLQQLVRHAEDIYLHTNDGRLLAVVVHHYRPDLLPFASVHLQHPLTVWQRQDNWSAVIRAAEGVGLWVGASAEELVCHGFSALQQHLLRIMEELFVVLAGEAEQSFVDMSTELETVSRFIPIPDADAGGPTDAAADGGGTEVSLSHWCYPPVNASQRRSGMMLKQLAAAELQKRPLGDRHDVGDVGRPPSGVSPVTERDALTTNGPSPVTQEGEWEGDDEGDQGDAFTAEREGERGHPQDQYSVIAAGLMLQGVAMLAGVTQGAQEQNATAVGAARNDEFVDLSSRPTRDVVTRLSFADGLPEPPAGDVPARSESPTVPSSAVGSRGASASGSQGHANQATRQHRPVNALAMSVAYFRATHADGSTGGTAIPSSPLATTAPPKARSLQGSLDAEGIDALLEELKRLSQLPPADSTAARAGAGSDLAAAKAQVQSLRWELETQQRQIGALVERLQKGLKRHEFNTIVKHLRMFGAAKASSSGEMVVPQHGGSKEGVPATTAENGPRKALDVAPPPTRPPQETPAAAPPTAAAGAERRCHSNVNEIVGGDPSRVDPIVSSAPPPSIREPSVFEISAGGGRGGAAKGTVSVAQLQLLKKRQQERLDAMEARRRLPPAALPPIDMPPGGGGGGVGGGGAGGAIVPPPGSNDVVDRDAGAVQQPPRGRLVRADGPTQVVAAGLRRDSSLGAIKRNHRSVMVNALKYACLSGDVNKPQLDLVLKIVDNEPENAQLVVLLKDEYNTVFKGLYAAVASSGSTAASGSVVSLQRIYGTGPTIVHAADAITASNAPTPAASVPVTWKLFKFDTGAKRFAVLPGRVWQQAVDAFTLPPKVKAGGTLDHVL